MNIHERTFSIGQVPILAVGGEAPYRGTVLFYHGLGVDKETHRKELYSLAGQGFLALGIDAVDHGQRTCGYRLERLPMLEAILESAKEVPMLLEEIQRIQPDCGNFALVGISMGGCIAFAAGCNFPKLKAVVPLLSCPNWAEICPDLPDELWHESPHLTPEWYNPTALLIQNAGSDQHVPPQPARDFYEEAKLYYSGVPHLIEYCEYPNSDHFMEPDEWAQMWDRTLEWLLEHL